MRKLIVNKWKTPDGTILQTHTRHDYVSHLDANGKIYAVDGGLSYVRLVGEFHEMEDLCLYTDDPHCNIRCAFKWGTRGKFGRSELKFKLLKDLETDHIDAILETQTHIPDELKELFIYELCYRQEHFLKGPL